MKRLGIFAASFLFGMVAFSDPVPSDLRIVWQGNIGIPGGVPYRTNVFQVIPAGVSLATLQAALNICPSNGVVQLTNGTYNISGTLTIPDYVTLRGKGRGLTILNGAGGGAGCVKFGTGTESGDANGTVRTLVSGFQKDSTNVVLSSVSGLAVGQLMVMDELNQTVIVPYVTISGTYGTANWVSRSSGTRALGQTVEIQAINGSTVTFWPPMYWTLQTNLTPQAIAFSANGKWSGAEDLTVKGNNTGYHAMFQLQTTKYCWVKRCEIDYCDKNWVDLLYETYRCEIADNYFHDAYAHSGGSDFEECINVAYKSCANLVENNILLRGHAHVLVNWGSSGNVISYNYSDWVFDSNASGGARVLMYDLCGNHGAHPMMNLFEGNICNQLHDDSYWGSSSHNTLLRNWCMGDSSIFQPYTGRSAWLTNSAEHATQALHAFALGPEQSYYNVIGNIFGCSYGASHDVGKVITPDHRDYPTKLYLENYGYAEISDGGNDYAIDNTRPYYTSIIHGNFNWQSNSIVWDPTNSDRSIPASYYLASKPAFFGNRPFPWFDPTNGTLVAATNQPAGFTFIFGFPPTNTSGTAPAFLVQPQAAIRMANGGSTQLTVAVIGDSPLGLQWKKDGVAISGSNSTVLSFTSIATGDSATYTCVATNSVGTNTSTGGVLDVGAAPAFTTQPTSKTNVVGSIYTNLVAATGSPAYQWYIGPLTNFSKLNGSTNATLVYSNAPAAFYFNIISNAYATATSSVVSLTLTNPVTPAPPTISQQPDTQTGIAGGIGVVLRVVANGDAPITYQWYKDGVALDGRTDSLYGITPVTTNAAGTYKVAITNAAGFVISSNAIITINFAPYATTNPTDTRVDLSGTTNLTAAFNGKPVPVLQWQLNGTNIVSATNNTLILTTATLLNDGYYQAVASNSVALTTGAVARLSVIVPADPPPHVAFRIVTNAP